MHAVDILIAGVAGAENGTAELFARGTNSKISWWNDFEGTSQNAAGTDIALDANGKATAYVSQYARIRVKDASGAVLLDLVEADRDDAVEVVSPSFTGTDYQTAVVAANKPVTLAAVLDKLITSFGAVDWNVLFRGLSATLQSVVGHIRYFSVKSYGAVGDDVSDDSGFIQDAIDAAEAAGGGVVWFPPGTYFTSSTFITLKKEVSLEGDHASQCIIRSTTSSPVLVVEGGGGPWQTIRGLTIYRSTAQTNAIISSQTASTRLHVVECVVGGPSDVTTGNAIATASSGGELVVERCDVQTASTVSALIASGTNATLHVLGCRITVASGYNASASTTLCVIDSGSTWNYIRDNSFDLTATPANGVGAIRWLGTNRVYATGNFFDGVSGWTAFRTTAAPTSAGVFFERDNTFITLAPYIFNSGFSTSVVAYRCDLGSRASRSISYAQSGGGTLSVDTMAYGLIYVVVSDNTAFTIEGIGHLPDGAETTVVINNTSGGTTGVIGFSGPGSGEVDFRSFTGNNFTVGSGLNSTWRFVACTYESSAGNLVPIAEATPAA